MTEVNNWPEKIQQHIKSNSVSCTSMVSTIFGDVVSQHGHWLWLSSLIQALEPFGFNERQVRTSVYRLVQSNWLQVNKVGRCSYYCLTDVATGHYDKAARRIYADEQAEWDGNWTLVLPVSVPEEKKEELRKSLIWQGFNTLVSGVYAHPSSERSSLDETIHELGITNNVIVFNAKTVDFSGQIEAQVVIKALTKSRWQIAELEVYYQEFVDFYRPICRQIADKLPLPAETFLLRSALIHDFRRILLRDPDFPKEMLPQGWIGHEAHDLVKRMYKQLENASTQFIQQQMKNAQGTLPAPQAKFYQRFGGLEK